MNVFLKPAPDAQGKSKIVPDLAGGNLPAAGAWKPRTQYWLRRIKDGDVIDSTDAQTAIETAAKPAASPASDSQTQSG
jgi:hypothetical protein